MLLLNKNLSMVLIEKEANVNDCDEENEFLVHSMVISGSDLSLCLRI